MSSGTVAVPPPARLGEALESLWSDESDGSDAASMRGGPMPPELEARYGGPLSIRLRPDRPTVMANFVSTLDGVVAFGSGGLSGGRLVSGSHDPDRFVMGLLRAMADVVVVGAGTLRASKAHRWTADAVYPRSATAYAAWRRTMGLADRPTTVIVTGSGDIPVGRASTLDPDIPVVIATTRAGARRLARADLGSHIDVEPIAAGGAVSGDEVVALSARLGARLLLTEGGPHLLGRILADDQLDELFLTLAPQLVGRDGDDRLGLVEGLALHPAAARWLRLDDVRRSGDHLFLRYGRRSDRHPATED
jgi:riboflavin biosynthesis pyrimidine reductase